MKDQNTLCRSTEDFLIVDCETGEGEDDQIVCSNDEQIQISCSQTDATSICTNSDGYTVDCDTYEIIEAYTLKCMDGTCKDEFDLEEGEIMPVASCQNQNTGENIMCQTLTCKDDQGDTIDCFDGDSNSNFACATSDGESITCTYSLQDISTYRSACQLSSNANDTVEIGCEDAILYNFNRITSYCYDENDGEQDGFCRPVALKPLFVPDTDLLIGGIETRRDYTDTSETFDPNDDSCYSIDGSEWIYYLENGYSDEDNVFLCCGRALLNQLSNLGYTDIYGIQDTEYVVCACQYLYFKYQTIENALYEQYCGDGVLTENKGDLQGWPTTDCSKIKSAVYAMSAEPSRDLENAVFNARNKDWNICKCNENSLSSFTDLYNSGDATYEFQYSSQIIDTITVIPFLKSAQEEAVTQGHVGDTAQDNSDDYYRSGWWTPGDPFWVISTWTSTSLKSRILDTGTYVSLKNVPLAFENVDTYPIDVCTYCDFVETVSNPFEGKSACDAFGSPVDIKDCSNNFCPQFDYCTYDEADDTHLRGNGILNAQNNFCPLAQYTPYIYKDELPPTLQPNWQRCYDYIAEKTMQISDGDLDNIWYLTPDVVLELCAEQEWLDQPFLPQFSCDMAVLLFYGRLDFEQEWVEDRENQLAYCFTFNENKPKAGLTDPSVYRDQPCLAFYDKEQRICAMCKINSARIFMKTSDGTKYVVCGSIVAPELNDAGQNDYLNPADFDSVDGDTTVFQDYVNMAAQNYECKISQFYFNQGGVSETIFNEATQKAYYPRKYLNQTVAASEIICVTYEDFIPVRKACASQSVAPDAEFMISLTSDEDQVQKQMVYQTVGCNDCKSGYITSLPILDEDLGIYYQKCTFAGEIDLDVEGAPCDEIGYIKQWRGYIESEQTLECVNCQDLIPNCLLCSSKNQCSRCQDDYYPSDFFDDYGKEHQVCLKNFCGLQGFGENCDQANGRNQYIQQQNLSENCQKAKVIELKDLNPDVTTLVFYNSCMQCEPGYFSYIKHILDRTSTGDGYHEVYGCKKQYGDVEKNFFVRPELASFFDNDEIEAGKMYKQLTELNHGQVFNDPLYFLQQAFSLIGDWQKTGLEAEIHQTINRPKLEQEQEVNFYSEYEHYENVTFNIWLFKGEHHFVQCLDHLGVKYPEDDFEPPLERFPTLCKNTNTFYPLKRSYQKHDNVKFYIRPLECRLGKTLFKRFEEWGPKDIFEEYCIDFEKGDAKPLIRVHGSAAFNITNFAEFENIQFTGEDNLAVSTTAFKFLVSYGKIQEMMDMAPMKFCNFTAEPKGYLEDNNIEKIQGENDNFSYTCEDEYAENNQVAQEIDQECTTAFSTDPKGVRSCSGEPFHEDFFAKTTYNKRWEFSSEPVTFDYMNRHKVLFNLYAFDAYRSNLMHAPTLNLINCDFKYFYNVTALIQVETNNFIEMGIEVDSDGDEERDDEKILSRFLVHVGDDRGARIDIQDSTFKHSKFCKGMISYRKTQVVEYADEQNFFMFKNQIQRDNDTLVLMLQKAQAWTQHNNPSDTQIQQTDSELLEANPDYYWDDGRAQSYIHIKDSVFENLAHHQTLEVLSNQNYNTVQCGNSVEEFANCVFEAYDNRGFVLNVEGFNGIIQIEDSTFKKNMAYIKDYLVYENQLTDSYVEMDDLMYTSFENESGQLNFKVCDMTQYQGNYVFQLLADSRQSFDDVDFVQIYEQVSTLMIRETRGPLIIKNNTFEENIGTIGGAIHIMQPDFEHSAGNHHGEGSTNKLPYIYIEGNSFTKNMAYFAGNALYMSHSVRNVNELEDYLYMCGAGVYVANNQFYGNHGLKKHNGGAISHHCLDPDPLRSSSSFEIYQNQTNDVWDECEDCTYEEWKEQFGQEAKHKYIYEDPLTTYDQIVDIFYQDITYSVQKYATVIVNNTFEKNFAGMKGSAIDIQKVSLVSITQNIFNENGPVTSFSEREFSPYEHYFQPDDIASSISFNKPYGCFRQAEEIIDDEFLYAQWCYSQLSFIDMPALLGAINIDSCQEDFECYYPHSEIFKSSQAEYLKIINTHQKEHQINEPYKRVYIDSNVFENNQVLPLISQLQSEKQASSLRLKGGRNFIRDNEFKNHRTNEILKDNIKYYSPDIYSYVPDYYFEYSQASIIYITYHTDVALFENQMHLFNTTFENNSFVNNSHIQIILNPHEYDGSLIYYQSSNPFGMVYFANNHVEYNSFRGLGASLISFDGGIITIEGNNILHNGYISDEIFQKNPSEVTLAQFQEWPYPSFIFKNEQMYGVFHFQFLRQDLVEGKSHYIRNNHFNHNVCAQGCSYRVMGTSIQQLRFENNSYTNLLASSYGTVLDGKALNQKPNLIKFFLLYFLNETVTYNAGGAIDFSNMEDVGFTIIEGCKFKNNIGEKGSSINMWQSGSLVAIRNSFEFDEIYQEITQKVYDVIQNKIDLGTQAGIDSQSVEENKSLFDIQALKRPVTNNIIDTIKAKYSGYGDYHTLISLSSFEALTKIETHFGQIYINNSGFTITEAHFARVIVAEGEGLFELLIKKFNYYEEEVSRTNIFLDNTFKNLQGKEASAIALFSTRAVFLSRQSNFTHFERNISPEGSTIYGFKSTILMRDSIMKNNVAATGGCFIVTNTELDTFQSTFENNIGIQGGVVFAVRRTLLQIRNSTMKGNLSSDGGVLYAMSCEIIKGQYTSVYIPILNEDKEELQSLRFIDTKIEKNFSIQNLVQIISSSMSISSCEMTDNYCNYVTHGITLISAQLYVDQTLIQFTEEGQEFINKLDLNKLDTGVFNLYLGSLLHLSQGTEIRKMTAMKQSVLSAISQSSIYMSNDVKFIDCDSQTKDGFTMWIQNSEVVDIQDASFIGNQQINVYIELGNLKITNSTFTAGLRQHIVASQSFVTLDNVRIVDSEDSTSLGHGLICDDCYSLNIIDSTFRNLTALQGPAIYITNQMAYSTLIQNCIFDTNHAQENAGAIKLMEAGTIHINQSQFLGNYVENIAVPTYRQADAGAIYYRCEPNRISNLDSECEVILDANVFEGNKAKNNGGALRYVNKNFTTVYQEPTTGRRILSSRSLQDIEATDSNTFRSNEAIYGANLASYPSDFGIFVTQNNKTFNSQDPKIQIAPGQNLVLKVEIYDQEKRLYSDENDASATVILAGLEDLPEGSTILNPQAIAQSGVIEFGLLNIRQTPGTAFSIEFEFENLDQFGNEVPAFKSQSSPQFPMSVRECLGGEFYGESLTCLPCAEGFRLYDVQEEPGVCDPCSATENCYGSNSTSPISTFWRSSTDSTNYLECFNPDACLGGNQTQPLGTCAEGYDGILCANCIGRYRRKEAFVCEECPSPNINIALSCCYFLAMLIAVVALVRMTMKGSNTKKPLHPVYLKIFLNHFQILQVISQINFGWPNMIDQVLQMQKLLASLPVRIISFDCLLIDNFSGPDPDFRLNYLRLAFFAVLPFIVIVISFIFWLLAGCIARNSFQQITDKMMSTIAVVWFLFYPTIVTYLAQSINCTEIEGVKRLYDDLEQVCWQDRHLSVVYMISIPGLILIAFGIPFLGLFLLRRSLRNLEDAEFHSDPKIHGNMYKRFRLQLGFLTQGYQDDYYYWEIVLLLRKTVLVLLMVFFAPISAGIQALCAIMLLIVSLITHVSKQPFYAKNLNDLESTSLMVQIIIIYFGLYYLAGKEDEIVKSEGMMYCIFTLVITMSILFIAIFIIRMRMEMLKATVKNHSICFAMLSCCTIKNKKAFIKEHQVGALQQGEILLSKITEAAKRSEADPSEFDGVDPAQIKVHVEGEESSEQYNRSVSELDLGDLYTYFVKDEEGNSIKKTVKQKKKRVSEKQLDSVAPNIDTNMNDKKKDSAEGTGNGSSSSNPSKLSSRKRKFVKALEPIVAPAQEEQVLTFNDAAQFAGQAASSLEFKEGVSNLREINLKKQALSNDTPSVGDDGISSASRVDESEQQADQDNSMQEVNRILDKQIEQQQQQDLQQQPERLSGEDHKKSRRPKIILADMQEREQEKET